MSIYDIAIIGAGIAGASFAASVPPGRKVVMLEMESVAGYHATSRSAAMFEPTFGPPAIRALTRASEAFFHHPPEGFAGAPLVQPRGVLLLAEAQHSDAILEALTAGYAEIEFAEARRLVPLLRARAGLRTFLDTSTMDADVDRKAHV